MKYVMIRRGSQVLPIIFPDFLVHDEVAHAIVAVVEKMEPPMAVGVVSAGDVQLGGGVVSCSGGSQTLGLQSRNRLDANVIMVGHYRAYME